MEWDKILAWWNKDGCISSLSNLLCYERGSKILQLINLASVRERETITSADKTPILYLYFFITPLNGFTCMSINDLCYTLQTDSGPGRSNIGCIWPFWEHLSRPRIMWDWQPTCNTQGWLCWCYQLYTAHVKMSDNLSYYLSELTSLRQLTTFYCI